MNNFKNQKGISLIVLIIIIVIVVGFIIYIATYNKNGHKLTNEEKTVYTNLRNTITQAVSSSDTNPENRVTTISNEDLNVLKDLVGQDDIGNDKMNLWLLVYDEQGCVMASYDSYDALIQRGYTVEETKEYEITYIYDGQFVSIFYVRHIGDDYYLFDYDSKPLDSILPNSVLLNIE